MKIYPRTLKNLIEKKLKSSGKAIVIYGARQVGKTSLTKEILTKGEFLELNCDYPEVRSSLEEASAEDLKKLIGSSSVVFIDEAQRVENIGLTIKILVDNFPKLKIITTGSSSFDLANSIKEPLTGRKYSFLLLPLAVEEILNKKLGSLSFSRVLPDLLIYGSYPEVVSLKSTEDKVDLLKELTGDNLYKDILSFNKLRNAKVLRSLLKALALQIGNEVSNTELSQTLGVDKNTIESYLDILEQSFIIFRLSPFFRNKRNELKKQKKIYFYDLGIRNTLINNFNKLDNRSDVGNLWENFCILERLKIQEYHRLSSNNFFWRTYDGAEIDWVEEREGKLYGFKIKWSERKTPRAPKMWAENYDNSSWQVISPSNFLEFIKMGR